MVVDGDADLADIVDGDLHTGFTFVSERFEHRSTEAWSTTTNIDFLNLDIAQKPGVLTRLIFFIIFDTM